MMTFDRKYEFLQNILHLCKRMLGKFREFPVEIIMIQSNEKGEPVDMATKVHNNAYFVCCGFFHQVENIYEV